MLKEFTFSLSMLFLSISSFAIGIYLSLVDDFKWFSDFGSLIVLFGVASEYSLLQNELKALYRKIKGQGGTADGNTGIPDLSPKKIHIILARTSHFIIIFGTIIWGFGERFLSTVLENA